MNKKSLYINMLIGFCFVGLNAQVPYKSEKQLAQGGQFKDLVLPMPIYKNLETKNIWGGPKVIPRDIHNGMEDDEWCYWGGNPIQGKDGNYHLAVCRWPEANGHNGWHKAEVAHCVSKRPMGPYKVVGTLIEKKGINPEIIKLQDGTYMLHIGGGQIYTSEDVAGPWTFKGEIQIDTRGYKGLSHLFTNLTGVSREDGSILFFTKRGDVLVSNSGLLGPYKMVSAHNYTRYSGYPEDPVIWKSRHQYHVIYNHAIDKKSQYMRSLDGIHWINESGLAYDGPIFRYTNGVENDWYKRERPKVLQDEYGRATHLSLAVIDVRKRDDHGNDIHSSKNTILPLVKERLIDILTVNTIDINTQQVKLKISAEPDFKPQEVIDLGTLRLGSSEVVNFGGGAKAIKAEPKGDDLIITFDWKEQQLSENDFDLKLLGKTKSGELVIAYALLPDKVESPACLVAVPITLKETEGKKEIITSVENYGLKDSKPTYVKVFTFSKAGRELIEERNVPALKPYETFKVKIDVSTHNDSEFEAVLGTSPKGFWTRVNDDHYTISYTGDWSVHLIKGSDMYKESEKVVNEKDASVSYFFSGTQARCYGTISREMGEAEVYIDGNYIETIDCFFTATVNNVKVYETEVLPKGMHKLELRMTGKNFANDGVGTFSIDGFSFR